MTDDRPGEGVEDQVESELELGAEVVAGLEDVLGGELDEMRVRVDGNRSIIDPATSATVSGP